MHLDAILRTSRRHAAVILAGAAALAAPRPADAQYFGRSKVQYENFDFRVMHTRHFDVHFYPAESLVTADAARMAERWYARHSQNLGHTFTRKPLIFYANHPDFQQTNVIGGAISQGTGGVTEALRTRVVMPFTGVYAQNDHVLGHELVHVFQYDIAGGKNGGGLRGLGRLPLWLIEGMAEYLSIGREDPHTAMWLRDAALRNDLPTIRQLSRDPRYFPYRYGQAFWAYVGGRWGDSVIAPLFRASLRVGFERALRDVLGTSSDSLSKAWLDATRATYTPLLAGRTRPRDVGERVLGRGRGRTGEMDLSPSLSPDGRHVAFFSRRGIFSVDLFVADAETGKIIKRLTSPNTDSHTDAISFINSTGSWSPDGSRFAFVVQAQGDHQIAVFDVRRRRVERQYRVRGVGEITDPAWGPDGRIAFSGSAGGMSDIYLLDLATERVQRLTSDRHADLQPSWSPDGRTIVFATDRSPGTDFEALTFDRPRLALLDVASGRLELLAGFAGAKHINPQFSPDGSDIFFVSDRGGFSDIYRLSRRSGEIAQVTRLATGVSGITELSPALTVSRGTGRLMFSVFDNAGYSIYRLEPERARGEPLVATEGTLVAGVLPPTGARERSQVSAYLELSSGGLPEQQTFRTTDYRPSLRLDYIGAPTVGVGVGPSGAMFGGAVAAYFADMLNNHILGATLQTGGQVKDIGGQLFYLNQRQRWNWVVGATHTPLLSGFAQVRDTTVTTSGGGEVPARSVEQVEQRVYVDQASASAQYPFSTTRRFELSTTYTHVGYDFDRERLLVVGNEIVDRRSSDVDAPPGYSYSQAAAALVGDYSVFGFTSPVAGGRYRFEVSPIFGTVTFQTLLADYRRYLFAQPVTLAFRGMGFARVGRDAESGRVSPLFIGQESLIRGYALESFSASECTQAIEGSNECPEFERLVGSRIGVANVELRIPFFGTREFGLLNFPFLPTELSLFTDAGVAWTRDEAPVFSFARTSTERVPVVSTGVSARVNLFGYAVVEAYYAYPFQRPRRGAHFGFQLAPGW